MVICLERGADLHMAQLMPMPLIVFCFSKIHIVFFPFWYRLTLVVPEKKAVKRVCVMVQTVLLFCYHRVAQKNGKLAAVRQRCNV